jgi:23S rRNA (uracil1939-C5)-methyltransferase
LAVELYSGVGLFTAPLSARFGRTVAVESHPAAIEYARRNTDPRRVELVAADAAAWLAATTLKPEFVLVDPPREGLGIEASLALARLEAAELAYVSCDPATLARDVKALSGEGYTVASAVVVDMFPQTFHVEAVIRLRRAASTREK